MTFPSYGAFRACAIFAGAFGIFQSLIWIGFAITGIVAYYCEMTFTGDLTTMGSLLTLTFFNQYFRGTCVQNIFEIDMTLVQQVNLMPPGDVHAFTWVYLILHLFWGISSLTLLTNARDKYIRYVNIFLYIWIVLTIIISILDLALGILFAIDYDTLVNALFVHPYPTASGAVQVLATAVHVSGIMMVMAFRGFVFWLVNVGLAVYLFTQTFKIYDHNQMRRKSTNNGMTNGGFAHDNNGGIRRAPIDAYDMGQGPSAFAQPPSEYRRPLDRIVEQPPMMQQEPPMMQQQRPYEINPMVTVNRSMEPLARPQSIEQTMMVEERPEPRPIPPPPPPKNFMNTVVRRDVAAAKVTQELNYRNSFNVNNGTPTGGPGQLRTFAGLNLNHVGPLGGNDPDQSTSNYSPPMPRVNPFENRPPLRSVLRNSRYQ